MTPTLTAERRAEITDHLRNNPWDDVSQLKKLLKGTVLIDPAVPGQYLTAEMVTDILASLKEKRPAIAPAPPRPAADDTDEAPLTSSRVDTDEEPDLYVPDSDFPDYATNWDGTVICLGGSRKRKGKRMRPYAGWAKTASGKYYPTCYFRLSQNGTRHIQTPAQMLMRRFRTLSPKPTPTEAVTA